jgi:hypothetical protein
MKTKHVSCSDHSFSFLDNATDLEITEKKRKVPYVCASVGCYKLVETENKKKSFTVIKIKVGFV